MVSYYHHVRKAFDAILRYLDKDVGRPLLMVKVDNAKPEDLITCVPSLCILMTRSFAPVKSVITELTAGEMHSIAPSKR
jgi:hypothetical protein